MNDEVAFEVAVELLPTNQADLEDLAARWVRDVTFDEALPGGVDVIRPAWIITDLLNARRQNAWPTFEEMPEWTTKRL